MERKIEEFNNFISGRLYAIEDILKSNIIIDNHINEIIKNIFIKCEILADDLVDCVEKVDKEKLVKVLGDYYSPNNELSVSDCIVSDEYAVMYREMNIIELFERVKFLVKDNVEIFEENFKKLTELINTINLFENKLELITKYAKSIENSNYILPMEKSVTDECMVILEKREELRKLGIDILDDEDDQIELFSIFTELIELFKMGFIYIYTSFDYEIKEVFKAICANKHSNDIIENNQFRVNTGEVLKSIVASANLQEVKDTVLNESLTELKMRKVLKTLFKFNRTLFVIDGECKKDIIFEYNERRNVIMHNNGIIDKKYENEFKEMYDLSIGKKAEIKSNYYYTFICLATSLLNNCRNYLNN